MKKLVKILKLLRDMLSAVKAVRVARKSGAEGPLALIEATELENERIWLAKRDYENQLMQQCIIGGTNYESPCNWCEEHRIGECKREQHGKRGCSGWWLRFLTEEEEEACEQRAKAGESPENTQRSERDDESPAGECAD
jgi:hypothetical protein